MKKKGNTFSKAKILIAVFVFLFSIISFVLMDKEIIKKNELALAITSDTQNESIKKENARSLTEFIQGARSKIDKIELNFVEGKDVVPLFSFIEELAPKVGAQAEVSAVEVAKDGSALFIDVKANGNFESLYKFLTLLENAPYELEFISLNMKENKSSEVGNLWQVSMRLKIISFIP